MAITITECRKRSDRREWVLLPHALYRGDPNFVPDLIREELDFFSPSKNPGFQIAKTRLLLARLNGKAIGRVCGIIHELEEQKLGYKLGRFGWFESIDDGEVARALFGNLEDWFKAQGCRKVTGPQGFSDLDREGLLIEGFDWLPTIAGSYNKIYYPKMLEDLGYEKEVDYIEHRVAVPVENPLLGHAEKVMDASKRAGYSSVELRSKKDVRGAMSKWWDLLEESFSEVYGVTPLTADQKDYYQKKYFGFIVPELFKIVVDRDGKLQGFFLGLPSLSRPFQKANGKLLPFGLLHILRGLRSFETVDFYLGGLHPNASRRRVIPLLVLEMYNSLRDKGVQFLETNRELETNTGLNSAWRQFQVINKRRSRIFKKELSPTRLSPVDPREPH